VAAKGFTNNSLNILKSRSAPGMKGDSAGVLT